MLRAKRRRRRTPTLKRRKSRLVPVGLFVVVCLGLAWFFELQATTTIIFVRHTDTEDASTLTDNPSLSGLGHRRAILLADALIDIDVVAGVDAIYVSDQRRTQETAAPLARRLDIEPEIADPYQVKAFMAEVLREHKGDIVLVVTHGDILAPLVEELHGSKNIPALDGDNYDNIYVVTIPWFGKVKTLRIHYGMLLPPGLGTFSKPLSDHL